MWGFADASSTRNQGGPTGGYIATDADARYYRALADVNGSIAKVDTAIPIGAVSPLFAWAGTVSIPTGARTGQMKAIANRRDTIAAGYRKGARENNVQLRGGAATAMEDLAIFARDNLLDANGKPKRSVVDDVTDNMKRIRDEMADTGSGIGTALVVVGVAGAIAYGATR